MSTVHEAAEIIGHAVKVSGSEPQGAVVSPAEASRKFGHGHELDARDAGIGERRQLDNCTGPGAFRGEGADVHFVKNLTGYSDTGPCSVAPLEGATVYYLRGTVRAERLKPGRRIGKTSRAIEPVSIAGSGAGALDKSFKITGGVPDHRIHLRFAAFKNDFYAPPLGRPDPKVRAASMDFSTHRHPALQQGIDSVFRDHLSEGIRSGVSTCLSGEFPASVGSGT